MAAIDEITTAMIHIFCRGVRFLFLVINLHSLLKNPHTAAQQGLVHFIFSFRSSLLNNAIKSMFSGSGIMST